MTAYKNFTVDFPKRLMELDQQFRPIATSADLEVSYLLMKLTASFLLPYERIEGTSGARRSEIANPQRIRNSWNSTSVSVRLHIVLTSVNGPSSTLTIFIVAPATGPAGNTV